VTFHTLDDNLTRVHVEMEYFPKGVIEKTGNVFLSARRRARKDLRLFKHFIEMRNEETGEWRGEISKDSEREDQSEAEQAPEEAAPATDAGDDVPDASDVSEVSEEEPTNGEAPRRRGRRERVGARARSGESGQDRQDDE
jgi:hypothetical protein